MTDAVFRNREAVRAGLDLLDGGHRVQWQPAIETAPGAFVMGYPDYADTLRAALGAARALVGDDVSYLEHVDDAWRRPIPDASAETVATMLTFIERGERFVTGHIASFVSDGQLAALFRRTLALSDPVTT